MLSNQKTYKTHGASLSARHTPGFLWTLFSLSSSLKAGLAYTSGNQDRAEGAGRFQLALHQACVRTIAGAETLGFGGWVGSFRAYRVALRLHGPATPEPWFANVSYSFSSPRGFIEAILSLGEVGLPDVLG